MQLGVLAYSPTLKDGCEMSDVLCAILERAVWRNNRGAAGGCVFCAVCVEDI
jgi:hypothetical protein